MNNIKGFLIDLDGVLYIEDRIIPGAVETVNWLRDQGFPLMIGDTIDTDIIGAQAVGMPTILVRTGNYAFDAQ